MDEDFFGFFLFILAAIFAAYHLLKKRIIDVAQKLDQISHEQRSLREQLEKQTGQGGQMPAIREEIPSEQTVKESVPAAPTATPEKMHTAKIEGDALDDVSTEKTQAVPPAPTASNIGTDEINEIAYGVSSAAHAEDTADSATKQTEEITWYDEQGETKTEDPFTRFFMWLRKDWPMKVGGILVILAIGWFVTYAAQQGWLSETARVVMGYLFGIICLTYGIFRAEKVRLQGNLFLVIGIAAIFISTLAGVEFPTVQLSATAALFIMLAAVGLVTLVSLRQENITLTGVMISFGAVVPLFFFSGVGTDLIFAYIFVLTLGTLWVVSKTGWRALTLLMLLVVAFYSIAYMGLGYFENLESWKNLLISFLFAMVFYFANVSAILIERRATNYDLAVTIGTTGLFLLWVLMFAPQNVEVFFLLLGVLLFSGASYAIYRFADLKAPTALYAGASLILLAVATALQFDGAVLTIAYLMEVTVTIILAMYIMREKLSQVSRLLLAFLYIGPLLMVFGHIVQIFQYISNKGKIEYYRERVGESADSYYSRAIEHLNEMAITDIAPDLLAVFVACLSAFMIAIGVLRLLGDKRSDDLEYFRVFAYIGGTLLGLIVWFVTHVFIEDYDVATFVSLFLYTATGVAFYVFGSRIGYTPYRIVGAILFVIVLARIFLVEIWEMDAVMRIITFFVLGALFISTAFISKNVSDKK